MKPAIFLFVTMFLFSACLSPNAGAPALTATPSLAGSPEPTKTATLVPSFMPVLTETPALPTITPLPTIPTFTLTFDVRTIVTATPAPKAECPKENPALVPDFRIPIMPGCFDKDECMFTGTEKEIQAFLNKGGLFRRLFQD
jgi:hypothetical protein